MSRSCKHSPFGGNTTARSEKHDKRLANRRFRRICNYMDWSEEDVLFPEINEISNTWCFSKDGKSRIDPDNPRLKKYLRK